MERVIDKFPSRLYHSIGITIIIAGLLLLPKTIMIILVIPWTILIVCVLLALWLLLRRVSKHPKSRIQKHRGNRTFWKKLYLVYIHILVIIGIIGIIAIVAIRIIKMSNPGLLPEGLMAIL